MKVILLERVGRYGTIGDEVEVKGGFARNYLLPQGKALRATKENREYFAAKRAEIEKRNAEKREQAAGIAKGLNGHSIIMIRQAGETGQLYGSVSSRDISQALIEDGFEVQRSQVDLAASIKTVGLHEVSLRLHAEIDVKIIVNVARSEDEAKRQAQGEDLLVVSYEDEAEEKAPDLSEVFEDEKQLEEISRSDDDNNVAAEETADEGDKENQEEDK